MTGFQTATRPDLTGPFTSTANTNSGETPQPVSALTAGYRQTIGNPGGAGVSTVRTVLELFDTASSANAAVSVTVSGYEAAGYRERLDASSLGLGPNAAARTGANVPVAPQFAQGIAKQGLVLVWTSGNLLLIQIAGGDSAVTLDAAARWVQLVQANAQTQGTPRTPPAGWLTYTHPQSGYSLWYPASWFDLGHFGVPDGPEYFSNERVGAPLELNEKGIWLTLEVADKACPSPPTSAPGQRQLMVGGQTVTRTSGYFAPPGSEGGWTIDAAVPGQDRCFSFRYYTGTQAARDANLDTADQMISSFRVP